MYTAYNNIVSRNLVEGIFLEEFTSKNKGMELGLYALEDHLAPQDNETPMTEYKRMKNMVGMVKIAEDVGLDVFGIGESHEVRFIASSPHTIMANIAGMTKKIKLVSASTV